MNNKTVTDSRLARHETVQTGFVASSVACGFMLTGNSRYCAHLLLCLLLYVNKTSSEPEAVLILSSVNRCHYLYASHYEV